jgi:threonine/homoserine/homoserine lactone efflux protein
MEFLLYLLGGVFIGVIVAAPIGPVNLICIRRTFTYGPLNGFFSGLGAALGDGVFAAITGFGLTAIAQFIEGYSVPLKLAGGIMLIFFGIHIYRAHVEDLRAAEEGLQTERGSSSLFAAIASTFALTITNPATLFGFTALFAGFSGIIGRNATFLDTAIIILGVIAGSAAWWFAVTAITGIFHRHIDDKVMHRINQFSGIAVSLFGVVVLANLIFS